MSIQDKIDNWELEILTIDEKQKEYIEKNNLKKKELRRKIADAKRELEEANNALVVSTVKEFFGEVTPENIAQLKSILLKNDHSINTFNE
ncbi:MAG: hypothetical protein UIC64_10175 [Agathobacter sp.]|nr:hypothetical protein [Agathobacter sp.]